MKRCPSLPIAARRAFLCAAISIVMIGARAGSVAHANGFIQISTASMVLTPTPADYANDYVEAIGAAGLQLKVKNTGKTGVTVMVRVISTPPAIAPGDLLVRTLTPPGPGGGSMSLYTSPTAVNQRLWSTGAPQGPFANIGIDVRIRNLMNYDDAAGGGTTGYSNTLMFTIFEP